MAQSKKFQFKTGTKAAQEKPATQPVVQPDMATLLNKLIDQKLAALTQNATTPAPVQDKDFALIEDSLTQTKEQVKPKLPKLTKEKPEFKAKKLVIENVEKRAEFEQAVLEFGQNRSIENDIKKKTAEGRRVVLSIMNTNLLYEGDAVDVNIKEVSNMSVKAEAVVSALVDMDSTDIEEIKAGVQQILDLARLGVIEFGKTSFERWVKGHGYDPQPFLAEHEPERRIYITPK